MSTYEEEHPTDQQQSSTNNNSTSRHHETLLSVLNNFLTQQSDNTEPQNFQQGQLESAIRLLDNDQMRDALLEQLSVGNGDVEGIPQEYIDSLERVDKKTLKPDQACSICTNDFLDDPYPLVVKLPCDGKHRFDLECISPWLSVKGTCPLCRTNLLKNEKKLDIQEDSEEEEEGWDMYS